MPSHLDHLDSYSSIDVNSWQGHPSFTCQRVGARQILTLSSKVRGLGLKLTSVQKTKSAKNTNDGFWIDNLGEQVRKAYILLLRMCTAYSEQEY